MGPSMIVDGDALERRATRTGCTASMGPSMIVDGDYLPPGSTYDTVSRFNGAVDDRRRRPKAPGAHPLSLTPASMGPSMIVDGDGPLPAPPPPLVQLQWGRR